jgi:hypothetical protein
MTKRIASLIGLALLAATSASAQIINKVQVNVPFSFAAAGTTWAAGSYKLDINLGSGLAMLYSRQSGSRAFLTQIGQIPDTGNTRVRFERYGNQWVLRAIVGDGLQADMLPSKLERELISRKPSGNRTLLAHVE